MPTINLIYEKRVAIRKDERRTKIAMCGFVGSIVVGALAFGMVWFQTESARGDAAFLQAQVDKMEPILRAIEAGESQYNSLSPRLTTLQDAAITTQRWARVLDHISRHTPGGVWLTQLRCVQTSETEPIAIEIQGMGPTQEAVSEFILRIQSSEDLENVNLKYTQGDQVNEQRITRFEVSGAIRGTAKAVPQPAEGEGEGKGS